MATSNMHLYVYKCLKASAHFYYKLQETGGKIREALRSRTLESCWQQATEALYPS